MAQRFVACDRDQSFLLPPDVRDWLPEEHFAWFVIDAVNGMDLDAFYAGYRADGSRPPYDPAMMVALLLYAFARGTHSSRRIERACVEDVAFRVLAGLQQPDDATIARFVERHQDALAGLFNEVLALCAKAGLAQVAVLAVDGTKIQANASRNENLDYEQIAREIVDQAIATDAAEDEAFGDGRGDEMPEPLRTGDGRQKWLKEARRELERQRTADPKPIARDRPERVKDAKRRMDEELWTEIRANRAYKAWRARGVAADGSRRMAPGTTKPFTPPDAPEGRTNITDPDSKVVRGLRGWIQGYNAQAVSNEHQIILAAEITTVGDDFGNLEPMLDAAQHALAAAGVHDTPGVLLADAGYWHKEQMENVVNRGIQVLIPPDTSRQRATRRNWTGGHYDFMRRVLATDHGREFYRKRQPMIEPVFAQVKFNRGLDRFKRRGRGAVRTEWRLITATHNLLKLHRHATAPI
jgi:transposase